MTMTSPDAKAALLTTMMCLSSQQAEVRVQMEARSRTPARAPAPARALVQARARARACGRAVGLFVQSTAEQSVEEAQECALCRAARACRLA